MTRVQQIINAVAEAKRKPKKTRRLRTDVIAQATPLMDPKEMDTFVLTSLGYGDILNLLAYTEKGVSVGGKVTRTSRHYSHENTVTFELFVEYDDSITPQEQAEVDDLASKVDEQVSEEVKDCSRKIYRALEREWDHRLSDEVVDGDIESNWADNTWDEYGGYGGDLTWAQLDDSAKEKVREKWREGIYQDSDTFWSEFTIDEWKEELDTMGFEDAEISWSGFSSQGDGASFTCSSFDLQKFANFFTSGKDKERGHPYTDELFQKEYEAERQAAVAVAQAAEPGVEIQRPPAAESLVSRMLEGDEMKGYADAAVRNVVDIGQIMNEQPVRYMTGARQYEWSQTAPSWIHKVKVKAVVYDDYLPDQPWDISILVTRGSGNWWTLDHSISDHDEKVNFSINVSNFIPEMDVCVRYYGDGSPELLTRKIEEIFNKMFGTDEHFLQT